mgnify:FL=1
MSSQLNVDTIVDKAGSGGTNVKIGNTSTYVSDGGAVTQNTVQGIAKSWAARLSTADASINDSLNVSSTTDTDTGRTTVTFTNNFTSINFSVVMGVESNYPYKGYPASASTMFLNTINSANSHADGMGALTAHGDLA